MNESTPLTNDQAKLIQELGLHPKTVIFKDRRAALPCQIEIDIDGQRLKRWLFRDQGKLKLGDEKPSHGKLPRRDAQPDNEAEPLDLENKGQGKWRQTGKRLLSDCDAPPTYNPDELEAYERRNGYEEAVAKAIVAQICDGLSIREAAKKVGLSHSFIGAARIQREVKSLRKGKLLAEMNGKFALSQAVELSHAAVEEAKSSFLRDNPTGHVIVHKDPTLTDAMRSARKVLAGFPPEDGLDAGHFIAALEEMGVSATASRAEISIATIAFRPACLLDPKAAPCLKMLVELLTDVRYGSETAAASARRTLKILTKGRQGNACRIPDTVLATESLAICVALHDLRKAWQVFDHEPRATRLEGIRKLIGEEERDFKDMELKSLLLSGVGLPEASARVAAKATGISYKTFLRVWNQNPQIQKFFEMAGCQ